MFNPNDFRAGTTVHLRLFSEPSQMVNDFSVEFGNFSTYGISTVPVSGYFDGPGREIPLPRK